MRKRHEENSPSTSRDGLSNDPFIKSVIQRKVRHVISVSSFDQHDREDLEQEIYIRVAKSVEQFDEKVGHLYRILLDLGVETVPCLIHSSRDGFTGNRMVNQLSASQEMRMLRKSLEELDEKTIAGALGMHGIGHRLNKTLLEKLHPDAEKAFNANKINLQTARELVNVKPERQHEMLRLMESCNDYSTTFAKGLVLKTPAAKRAKVANAKNPWSQADDKKTQLLKKLQQAEQQQDFYTGLYRQYTTNLLKLVIYVRSLVNNPDVKSYLQTHHVDQTRIFEEILASTEG